MSNVLYNPGREGFSLAEIDWDGDDIRVMLVLSSYAFNAAHKFVSDLGVVDNGRSAVLTGRVAPAGIHDADDTSVQATAELPCKALVIFQHTGNDATARLIGYIDSPSLGLPVTPAAGQVLSIAWDNGPNRIFKL